MSTGPVAVRGRVLLCSACGGVIVFVELYADGRKSNPQAERLTRATRFHAEVSPGCKDAPLFDGPDVGSCRCAVPLRMERPSGLYCAKCNGQLAPHLRPEWPPGSKEASEPCPQSSTQS
jgi:hypothetical protein